MTSAFVEFGCESCSIIRVSCWWGYFCCFSCQLLKIFNLLVLRLNVILFVFGYLFSMSIASCPGTLPSMRESNDLLVSGGFPSSAIPALKG